MLRKEDFMVMQALAQRGLYLCDIAKQVGVHPRTVRRALARGRAPASRPTRRRSRLDPYRADSDRLVAESVGMRWASSGSCRPRGLQASSRFCGTTSDPSGQCASSGRRCGLRRRRAGTTAEEVTAHVST
ncbi:MAG: hypothetical protein P0121_06405 [Nitrospira sp.]|nr:hypothetical protein [Nitrospira sp.]